jgi:hypothetical protein
MKITNSSLLRNGDVLHCKRNSFLSKAIRFFTVSDKTSHTAIVLKIHGNVFIVDSQADGTRIREFDQWNEKYNYDVIITRKGKISEEELIERVKVYLNSPYGFFDLLRHVIFYRLGVWLGSKREGKRLTCSEFVMSVFGGEEAYRFSPEDAYIWCLENGYKVVK